MSIELTTEDIIFNLRKKIRIKTNSARDRICVAYFMQYSLAENYLILRREKIDFEEMVCLIRNCLPSFDISNINIELMKKLNDKLLNLHLPKTSKSKVN